MELGFRIFCRLEILKFSFIVWVADFLARKKNFQVFSRSLMLSSLFLAFLQCYYCYNLLVLRITILVFIAGTRLIYLLGKLCWGLCEKDSWVFKADGLGLVL